MSDFLAPVLPFPRQCDNWYGGYYTDEIQRSSTRCTNSATYWLVCPDGKLCPGGPLCDECAVRIVLEYGEKLGEWWSVEPLRLLVGGSNTEWRYAT